MTTKTHRTILIASLFALMFIPGVSYSFAQEIENTGELSPWDGGCITVIMFLVIIIILLIFAIIIIIIICRKQ